MEDPRFDIVKNLLDLKADINKKDTFGRTMLHRAIINCDVGMIKFLLLCKEQTFRKNVYRHVLFHEIDELVYGRYAGYFVNDK